MPVVNNKFDERNKPYEKVWISPQECSCCFCHITAFTPSKRKSPITNKEFIDPGEIYFDTLGWNDFGYWRTWRGRLKAAWLVLRGRIIHDSFVFYSRNTVEKFIKDLHEAVEFAFPYDNEKKEKSNV